MRNMSLPAWSAPLIGIVVGMFIGLRAYWFHGGRFTDACAQLGISTLIGVIAGVLIWLAEPPQTRHVEGEAFAGDEAFRASLLDQGTVLTRLGALLALALCWVPFLGFVLGAFAAIANRGVYGWPCRVSNWSALLGILATVGFVAMMVSQNH